MHPAFVAGLSTLEHIKAFEPLISQFFRALLKNEFVVYDTPHYEPSLSAEKKGWVAVDDSGRDHMVEFPSPLHRAWMAFRLEVIPVDLMLNI